MHADDKRAKQSKPGEDAEPRNEAKDSGAGSASDVPHPAVGPRSDSILFPEESTPPRSYGYWSCSANTNFKVRPKALILFAGRARTGDLHQTLVSLGWRVCSVDTLSPRPTDLLDDAVFTQIMADLEAGFYDAVWIATPCNTFSPLRGQGDGPRPLRSLQHIAGLPSKELTKQEQKQLRDNNILISRSSSAISSARKTRKPWGLENPKHKDDQPSLWLMPTFKQLLANATVKQVIFDQCMTGLETTKPTLIAHEGIDLSSLANLRCNHPKVQQTDSKGKTYWASHPSPAQRWRKKEDGTMERASKALGEYTPDLSLTLAQAFHKTQQGAQWLRAELGTEPLP